ncbi:hypothetical protein Cus16_3012 [Curtobacterium sp. ER1/6]|nr:hypothetical protein Cus16_3012 [Curtobacterium sp. ER1/6]
MVRRDVTTARDDRRASTGASARDRRQDPGGPGRVLGADVQVRHEPDAPRPELHHPDTLLGRRRDEGRGVGHLSEHDVRVDRRRVDAERRREHPRVGVVLGEPFDVVLQRVPAGGREEAGLPHAAAVPLPPGPSGGDVLAGTDEHRADRCAEALRQADGHGVEAVGELAEGDPGRDVGVPEPGAVEVHRDAVLAGEGLHRRDLVAGLDGAAAEVVRVLDRDRRRRHAVRPGVRLRDLGHRRGDEPSALGRPGPRGDAGEHGGRTELRSHHVGADVGQQFLAGGDVQPQPELVRHRAGGGEEPGLVPEQVRDLSLEGVRLRVLAEDVVADLGLGHRPAHRRGRAGDGVGAQVDRGVGHQATLTRRPDRGRPASLPCAACSRPQPEPSASSTCPTRT